MKGLRWIVKTLHNHKRGAKSQCNWELHGCTAEEGKPHDALINCQECLGSDNRTEIGKMCKESTEFRVLEDANIERIIFYDALRMKLLQSLYYDHHQQFSQSAIEEICKHCMSCSQQCNFMDCQNATYLRR
ncbi:uncharacterized protein LOC122020108 [Zingiber officinale]|uniref:uncharacterized protein LOC122020108 n=1 Tax=Zingiber officinale TaxID=94328 RepID=UPI001C4D2BF5|nr:uncharacterized protein LOC122020108 [Zingiber officinale]